MATDRIAGRYELLDEVAGDLVSDIFRANDLRDHAPVTIRVLKAEASRRPAEHLFPFKRLVRELSVLRHPNLRAILDQGEWKDRLHVILEGMPEARLFSLRAPPNFPRRCG